MRKIKWIMMLVGCVWAGVTYAQDYPCSCFDGIGSSRGDSPAMIHRFEDGGTVIVCGYLEERRSDDQILISEFMVFACPLGDALVTYDALQHCLVRPADGGLEIIEVVYLPAGEGWTRKEIQVSIQTISTMGGDYVTAQRPFLEDIRPDARAAKVFMEEVRAMKGTGHIENPDELIARLEVMALAGMKEATDILYDFQNYFNYEPDGAIAEQLDEAVGLVDWLGK
ncbi:MAG: hypothetical protein JNM00_06385 [Flavobacteriales bacterium]|nr:hypothetical protein [Flavobacteriales bacterium]